MIPKYTEKENRYEMMLYEALRLLEAEPRVIIGEKSFTKLVYFLTGYEYAFMQMKNYRLHFDREFQEFISKRYPTEKTIHWDRIISEGRTEIDAYQAFFELLHDFLISSTDQTAE